jgi:uncharacterized protein YfaP (DUF2135 family)
MRAAVLLIALAACTDGVDAFDSSGAALQVAGGAFVRGAPPAGDASGPQITSVTSPNNKVHPGEVGKRLGGTAQGSARQVAFYLDGDSGYWLVPVGLQDATTPTDLDFDARMSFARTLDLGPHQVQILATDANGVFGAPSPYAITIASETPPSATLDVQLVWDTEADVDLHVTEPDGVTIWARNINAYTPPPPGSSAPPGDPSQFGVLDQDSNASCVIDGRREENVYWTVPPPHGHYVVHVDTWSLCGQPAARWHVAATMDGAVLGQASGIGLDSDTTFQKSETSGVLALEFDIP